MFNDVSLYEVIIKDPYLIILDGSMHIKVASVCWQRGKIEAQKSKTMKLKQKPRNLVR